MKSAFPLLLPAIFAAFLLTDATPRIAAAPQTSDTASQGKTATAHKKPTTTAPSSEQIADARANGLVWANLSTHVYHKSDSSLYGTTKRGKFMTEDAAKKAGFRLANESGASKKQASASAANK